MRRDYGIWCSLVSTSPLGMRSCKGHVPVPDERDTGTADEFDEISAGFAAAGGAGAAVRWISSETLTSHRWMISFIYA